MRADTYVILSNVTPKVVLTHGNDSVSFSISIFGRASFQVPNFDVFEQLNNYWEYLDEQKQQAIFNIYRDIQNSYDSTWLKIDIKEYITERVTELFKYHSLQDMSDWLAFYNNITVPDAFNVDYEHSIDNNTTREKTYTKRDYSGLMTLALCLKCMVPIWGEYIANTRRDTGTDFKEYHAFQLLNNTEIVNSEPVEKLMMYIDNISKDKDKNNPDNTLKGISSEDYIFWLLALLCVKKLSVCDIRNTDPKTNIVTVTYKFIVQKTQNRDNDFENSYKEKKFDDKTNTSDANKISTLEKYKIKTSISPGEIVELEYSMKDMRGVANRLSSKVNYERLDVSLNTCKALLGVNIIDPQIILLSWVMKTVISPRGLMYLPKSLIVDALGVMEAILWERGHKYLALLATSFSVTSDKEIIISPVDSKIRTPQELSDKLSLVYPLTRVTTSKKKNQQDIHTNIVAESIDSLADTLMMYGWRCTAHESMVREVLGSNTRRIAIRPDIKILLTELVVELGNRSWY
jgi:hypothetical protein